MANREPRSGGSHGPGLERTITLTDAVVAIAMTLLVLPLVDVANELDPNDLPSFLSTQRYLLLSFVVSFLVIFRFWSAHGGAFRRLAEAKLDAPPGLHRINVWWLLVIAFLPFPTAVVGRHATTATAGIYLGTLLLLSALTSGMVTIVGRATGDRSHTKLAWLTTGVVALALIISLLSADVGLLALLLLAVVRPVETRIARVSR